MPISFSTLFPKSRPLIAMIHTGPSPGVPGHICVESAVERAIAETEVYLRAGVDGIIVENMRDFPCVHEKNMGPEISAFMTRVAYAVKRHARKIPVGVQVLFQANKTALAVAVAAGCDFIRAESWTYAHISDKGVATASAGETVRYRHQMNADRIAIFADIKKKHASHALTSDLSIAEIAKSMSLHRADGIIITGRETGMETAFSDLSEVRKVTHLPIVIGSGLTHENISAYLPLADGFIVGSSLKEGGHWDAPVSESRVQKLVKAFEQARTAHNMSLSRN